MSETPFVAVSIGNTRAHIGRFESGAFVEELRLPHEDVVAIVDAILAMYRKIADADRAPIAIASVQDKISRQVTSALCDQLQVDIYTVGEDLPIPIDTQLDPETITGVDRLLNATAAYATLKQACIVIDAGSAVTVDFVDGEGIFHGGAIAPGGAMQLRALHEMTDALPEVPFTTPDADAFGRSTGQAMLQGVFYGLRGLVCKLAERYAEQYGAYPQIIATGGDAEILFDNDDLVDRIVENLTLLGIAVVVRTAFDDTADRIGPSPASRHDERPC